MNIKTSYSIFCVVLSMAGINVSAQQIDTVGIYGERRDSLAASVFTARQAGSYLPKGKDMKVEVISSAGLAKMACCTLAESFENSASVTVGYSDAVTGARQIRLLGQSGIYTQMLDEARPVMRGLAAPFGLGFVPGQWLESIQISKGVSSVVSGVESMTGQINLEHKKPTDEKPLFIQASTMSDLKTDFNAVSSLQIGEKWSTVLLGHLDFNRRPMDMNGDGFLDAPLSNQLSFSNRWLYFDPEGIQVRFGIRAIADTREGGQMDSKNGIAIPNPWKSNINNKSLDGYVKVGISLNEDNTRNIAFVGDASWQSMDGSFGTGLYKAEQKSAFFNLLYQNQMNEEDRLVLGLSGTGDFYEELLRRPGELQMDTDLYDLGAFAEYSFHAGKTLSVIAGLREDLYNFEKWRFSPRLTAKWTPDESLVLRGNAGRGIRFSTPVVDNIGVLSTSKVLDGSFLTHPLEDSWTFGTSATWYLPFLSSYLSFDYFHTGFTEQMLVDYDLAPGRISFYTLGSLGEGARSFTDNAQLDFYIEPARGLSFTLTGRMTSAKQSFSGRRLTEKPMVSKYKLVLNSQYATRLNKWIFDFTASLNGPASTWEFMRPWYPSGKTPAYPLLYAQLTRRFKGFDVYAGGENLTGFRQEMPIISAENPWISDFDASAVWGPIMGAKFYVGLRFTIWKTE